MSQKQNTGRYRKKAFQNRAGYSPVPRCHNRRLRTAPSIEEKTAVYGTKGFKAKGVHFPRGEEDDVDHRSPPVETIPVGQPRVILQDGFVLSAPPKNLVDLLAEGAAFG